MNKRIRKLIKEHGFEDLMEQWRKKLSAPQHYDVLNHLVGFTGLDEDEVVFRCMRKKPMEFGARGWFFEEWSWSNPCGSREVDWHYRAAQNYLFSNARREPWDQLLENIGPKDGPVFEFGCGVGHNAKPLLDCGVGRVAFYEHNHLQHEFLAYRSNQWKTCLECHQATFPSSDWYTRIKTEVYNSIVCQDVLEHIPHHEQVLDVLVRSLRPGGKLYERSPFTPPNTPRVARNKPFHVQAAKPIGIMMKSCGLRLFKKGKDNFHIWKKVG